METRDMVKTISDEICTLGEGPIWHGGQGKLYWADIMKGRLWVFDYGAETSEVFWEGDFLVGGFAFTKNDDIVLCSNKGVHLLEKEGGYRNPPRPLFDIPLKESEMFNDIVVDPRGRLIAGTLVRGGGLGFLYRLEKGKDPVILLENLKCSNGMAFSRDSKTFYHTDSGHLSIKKYQYDVERGEISEPQVFYQGDREAGLPDGMTMDAEGCIWSAFWGGYAVRRFNPEGEMIREVLSPARQMTSVMFGGPKMDKLFATSAASGADDLATGLKEDGTFMGGPTYMVSPGVKGLPETPADF